LAGLLAMGVVAVTPEARAASGAGEFANETITVAGEARTYRLIVPATVDLSQPAPLVVALHGFGIDNKDRMPKYTGLAETAAAKKFLLVFPQALDAKWGLAPRRVAADLAFFDALVERLASDYRIDRKRIYVVGMSNGGYFAHVIGKERGDRVAAVASHSGPLGLQTLAGIRAPRKFPVMIVHGDQDRLFPIETARKNRDQYLHEGHVVEYVELNGVGHVWGEKQKVNNQIWEFFETHPLP